MAKMKIRVDSPIHRAGRVLGHAAYGAVLGAQVGMPGIGGFIAGASNALTQANEVGKKWAENSEGPKNSEGPLDFSANYEPGVPAVNLTNQVRSELNKRHPALNDKQNWSGKKK